MFLRQFVELWSIEWILNVVIDDQFEIYFLLPLNSSTGLWMLCPPMVNWKLYKSIIIIIIVTRIRYFYTRFHAALFD